MPETPDPELERWERMAAQEHPEVLPDCVEALQGDSLRLNQRADNIQEIHDQQRSRFNKTGAIVVASSVMVVAQAEMVERATGTEMPKELFIGAACLATGVVLFKEALRLVQYRFGLQRTRQRAEQVTALYRQAADRARERGLLPE